jgi:hypothetical protein
LANGQLLRERGRKPKGAIEQKEEFNDDNF